MRQHILQGQQVLSSSTSQRLAGGTVNAAEVSWQPHISYGVLSEGMLGNIDIIRKNKHVQTRCLKM